MAETRRSSPGAGKYAGSTNLAPGSTGAAAPIGQAGQADLRNVIGGFATRHADPLASGPRTTASAKSISPLTSTAWSASNLAPRMVTQAPPITGASRLNALNKVMGTSYGKPGTGAAVGNNSTAEIPAWLQAQIDSLQSQQDQFAAQKKADSDAKAQVQAQAQASALINPLADIKARVLQQDLARQQALFQDAVWNAQREKALATTTGMNQFIANRSVAPANPTGGWTGSSPFQPMSYPTAQQQMLANPYLSPYSYSTQPSTVVRASSTGPQYLKAPPAVTPSLPVVW